MARYIGLSFDAIPDSEREVATALSQLNHDWTVIHNVTWQSVRNGRESDGEADFLLLHPKFGAIVLEVKGGGIKIDHGRWTTKDRYGSISNIKNPFDQAKDSKFALLEYVRVRVGDIRLFAAHAVCLPDMLRMPELGPAASEELTLLKRDLGNIGPSIGRIIRHWDMKSSLSPAEVDAVINVLAPTLTISVPLAVKSSKAEQKILELTAEQVEALSALRCARGGSVVGPAGSGKTLLAIARARQLMDDGFRTLLVCYNELLGDQLQQRISTAVGSRASTFHSLCMAEIYKAGIPLPAQLATEWWERQAGQQLIEAAAANGTEFDAIVVDEAQDFAPNWLEALRCILRPESNAPFYTFADPNQELWQRNWSDMGQDRFHQRLTMNLRNTKPIAERACAAIGVDRGKFGVDGPQPVWRVSNERKHRTRDAAAAVETMVEEGFTPTSLVVLCESHERADRLREVTVGPFSLGKWGSNGIPVETIARFKGMETEAAILVLEDEIKANNVESYVGLSRPRSALTVVGPSARRQALMWN